jgi:protein involved in polysaccharide export with SLBB domain
VIKRAGGFTEHAFLPGAVFTRESIRQNQVEQYNDALAKIKRELAIYNAMPANAKKSAVMGQSGGSLNEVIVEAQKYQPIGRVSITLDENITTFEQSQFNIVLKDKDTLTIPSRIDTVTVFGEVFNPTSFVYDDTKDVDEYIAMASGYARSADTSNVYIIHADGTSEPVNSGWLSGSVNVQKGDTIVVPLNIKEYDKLEVTDSVAKILASFALTIAAMNSLGVF